MEGREVDEEVLTGGATPALVEPAEDDPKGEPKGRVAVTEVDEVAEVDGLGAVVKDVLTELPDVEVSTGITVTVWVSTVTTVVKDVSTEPSDVEGASTVNTVAMVVSVPTTDVEVTVPSKATDEEVMPPEEGVATTEDLLVALPPMLQSSQGVSRPIATDRAVDIQVDTLDVRTELLCLDKAEQAGDESKENEVNERSHWG
ncbi:hypothetical protein AYO22_06840 [Fonsecaea multimorphosa]|nr:hypothetical protein AYO22_06840 [Fonsecaea multimorphosa]